MSLQPFFRSGTGEEYRGGIRFVALNVYTSNRIEELVTRLGDVLGARSLADPFSPEVLVVQSRGMQRWLAMELAARFGVWANARYPFPNAFVQELFTAAVPEARDLSPFDPGVMTWRIMELLPDFLDHSAFASIRGYLAGGERELKLFQLAGKIADTFDQYTIFRPEMLAGWEAGREEHWQAMLWRALVAAGGLHRQRLREEFFSRLARRDVADPGLPERIAVFGISYLPKFHLEVFSRISPFTEVNLFVMSPCREYWADILPERVLARLSPEERAARIEGNPLLASLGRLGKEFSDTIVDLSATAGGEADLYRETDGTTLLEMIRDDILNLRGGEPHLPKRVIGEGDRSLRIHSCHSPMRETEVLHDNLLALFEEMKELEPRQVLVMTPDIEAYAPYISAIFDGCQDPSKRIPYSIADRSPGRRGRIVDTFLAILDLPGRRFPVTAVMDIFAATRVHERFGVVGAELDLVRRWLEETRIRWGMDEEERRAAGFPPFRENSWRAGLDRLLLGYAMPEEGGSLFGGMLPYDAMEGEGPAVLGRFLTFVERLHGVLADLERPRLLSEWKELLRRIPDDFFAPAEESGFELAALQRIFADMGELQGMSGFAGKVGLPVIRSWLKGRLEREQAGAGFLSGGVTFCAMLPMRSIPFRVIAIMGMNDDSFPRQNRPPGFDLIAAERRPGDRSLRDEDRYLFLEALLSARERLLISYTGQSVRDNTPLPPSVLVEELLDYLERRYTDGSSDFPASLATRHRLQPFSPAYFAGKGELFSYADEECRAVTKRLGGTVPAPPFVAEPLPEPPDELRTVSLGNLLSFFDNPARYFARTRLGITLDEAASPLEDREPFGLDSLDAYGLRRELLERTLAGEDPAALFPVARARGLLPPARQGEIAFRAMAAESAEFAGRVAGLRGGGTSLEPLAVDLCVGPFRVTGTLGGIWSERLVRHRCAKLSGRDQVRLWIEHLVLNAVAASGYPAASVLAMSDGTLAFIPAAESLASLETMLHLYWEGLRRPLRFFPRSAAAYAKKWELGSARTTWGGDFHPENNDPYYRLCFGGEDPLGGEFERISRAIFEPLGLHRGE